ncbi:MAG: 7-cyano-7-deazaguanine synthase QueC [Armatimonadota bacterium]|nr:7-cyano-7-deazaguanine synthase QueC [Armatimonadota bacterium]
MTASGNPQPGQKAVCLLSGGLDSSTAVAIAVSRGFEVYGLTFRYGQRHEKETRSASAVGKHLGLKDHVLVEFDLRKWGGSSLTDEIPVPTDRGSEEMSASIPPTYVPGRNTIFLSFGLAYAETLGADRIFIGVSPVDYSGYPDCREEYLRAFEQMANLGTKAGVEGTAQFKIEAPLLHMSKAEIIRTGLDLGVDYSLTWSCYQGGEDACGRCDSCLLRLEAFRQVGMRDPVRYVDEGFG